MRSSWMTSLSLVLVVSLTLPALAAGTRKKGARKPAPARAAADSGATVDATVPSFVDRVPIHYHAEGKGSPAIVFIHCWMGDSSFWQHEVATFAKDHRVVTLDLPGHGASGKDRKAWTMASYGLDVKTVVETLHLGKVVLVGHSMGGYVMLEAARIMPERVTGMIAVDTLHDADHKDDPKRSAEFLEAMRKDFKGTAEGLARQITGKKADPAVADKVAAQMSSGDPAIGVALMEEMDRYDLAAGFRRVRAPLVAINSTMFPTNVDANRKYLKSYTLIALPEGVGHFPQLEAPEAFDALMTEALAKLH